MGENSKIWYKRPYTWLIIFAVFALAILIYSSRNLLYDTWIVLQDANIYLVLLLPVIQTVNYYFLGGYYRTMFGFFETKIKRTRSWGVVASLNFVNQILPSGGLSGITYLSYGFRTKLEIGKTSMIQMGRYVFAFASYMIIGPFALLLLIYEGDSNFISEISTKIQAHSYALITLVAFLLLVALVISLIRSKKLSQQFMEGFRRFVNAASGVFGKNNLFPKEVATKLVNDFHDGLDFFKQQKAHIITPYFFMLLSASMELSIVYVSLLAVGAEVSFAAAFASFLAANIAGVISIIPGDVGIHEAVMTTMLVAFGVPAPTALSAVLLYRVFNKVIFLPIGFYFYSALLKPAQKAKA